MTTIDDVFEKITRENKISEVIRDVFTAVKFSESIGFEETQEITKAIAKYVDETVEPLPEDKQGDWHKAASSSKYILIEPIPASRRNWLAGYQGFVAKTKVSPEHEKYVEAQKVLDKIAEIANHYRD